MGARQFLQEFIHTTTDIASVLYTQKGSPEFFWNLWPKMTHSRAYFGSHIVVFYIMTLNAGGTEKNHYTNEQTGKLRVQYVFAL